MIGNIRRVDKEGRISLPKDYRDYLGINNLEKVEIICEEDRLIIRKTERGNK